MEFPPLIEGFFLERLNRFVGTVYINGEQEKAYIRNTGRLEELLFEGNSIYVKAKRGGLYRYEILLAKSRDTLVCIDSHIASKLYAEYLKADLTFEPTFGKHRFDLMHGNTVIEVKSVNLVKNRIALFPDAPTKRGKEHLSHLMKLAQVGYLPQVVFVVQREDAYAFSPNWQTDENFSKALKEFISKGYPAKAYKCDVSLKEITLKEEIPIHI